MINLCRRKKKNPTDPIRIAREVVEAAIGGPHQREQRLELSESRRGKTGGVNPSLFYQSRAGLVHL
jgi:hypothetical protein